MLFSTPSNGNTFADFDWTMPYKAIVSVGGNNWNIVAGRDKLSWGNGETGNLMLSDSFPKQTFARFSTYFNAFKYSLVFSVYPGIDSKAGKQFESLDGYKALVAHRLEFNLFNNKVGFEAMFMKHGSMNVNSRWGMYEENYENAPDVSTPTTFDPFDPADYDPVTDKVLQTHAVETSTILSLSAEYNILSCLSAYTTVDLLIVKNAGNVEGVNGTDVQVTLGASYSL